MQIIDGKKIAETILNELKTKPAPQKFLGAVLVGNDPASLSFLEQKAKTAKVLGVDFRLYKLSPELKNDDLREEVRKIAEHKTCGGMIVQLPLPEHVNRHYVLNAIPREKDLDLLSERALGAFYTGRNPIVPPSVETVREIFKAANLSVKELRIAVVGLGLLIGKPISLWLMDEARELFVLNKERDIAVLKEADVVISGVGKPGLIKTEMLKVGAGVLDFGYGVQDGKLSGDLDKEGIEKLSFYTPTPGGTGPILVAKLFENFYKLNLNTD